MLNNSPFGLALCYVDYLTTDKELNSHNEILKAFLTPKIILGKAIKSVQSIEMLYAGDTIGYFGHMVPLISDHIVPLSMSDIRG